MGAWTPASFGAATHTLLCDCRDNKGGLNLKEIWAMTEGNRNIMDPTGWVAEKLEWFVTYYFFANDEVTSPATCIALHSQTVGLAAIKSIAWLHIEPILSAISH